MLVLGYNLYQMGYKQGSVSVMNILGEGSGSITRLTDAFGILGLMVIGAMGAQKDVYKRQTMSTPSRPGKLVDEYRRLLLLSTTDGKPAAIIGGRPLSGCRFM